MRSILRLLPLAALILVAYLNAGAMKKHFSVISRVQVAATGAGQLHAIADAVAREFAHEGTLPAGNFPDFLRANLRTRAGGDKRDVARDAWGTEYQLAVKQDGFEVRSAGPDKRWQTDDDLSHFQSLQGFSDTANLADVAARARAAANSHTPPGTPSPSLQPRRPLAPLPRQSDDETRRKVLEFQQRRAAEGSAQAQFDMAIRYLEGDGVERNPARGRELLEQSAKGGFEPAAKKLASFPPQPKAN